MDTGSAQGMSGRAVPREKTHEKADEDTPDQPEGKFRDETRTHLPLLATLFD